MKQKKIFALGLLLSFATWGTVFAAEPEKDKLQQAREQALQLNQLSTTDPQAIIGMGIRGLMMFMGAIMFALVVYAGFIWMTAQGNGEKIDKARNIIVWSGLGVAVMLVSYIVVNFVFTLVSKGAV